MTQKNLTSIKYIAKNLKIYLPLCLPTNEHTRKKLHTIATGCSDIQKEWYALFINDDNNENTKSCNETEIQKSTTVTHSLSSVNVKILVHQSKCLLLTMKH